MASAADLAVQSAGYTGNAGLGGGFEEAVQIDTRPLQELSHYTFLYNRAETEERRNKATLATKELADNTSYDLSSAIPKDRAIIEKEYSSFVDWTKQNTHRLAKDPTDPIWQEYQSKKNKFTSLLSSAKVRDIAYKSRQASNATKNPAISGEMQRILDEEANSSDIYTPIKPDQAYDLAPVEIGTASTTTIDVVRKGDNQIAVRDYTLPNYNNAKSKAIAIVGGLIDAFPKEGSAEFNNLSEGAKNNIREQRKLQVISGKLQPVMEAEAINSVLNKTDSTGKKLYFDEAGNLDVNALMKGESGNGLFSRVMKQIDNYNNGVIRIKDAINGGEFQDKTGKKLSFGFGVDEADYQPIDLGKGSITPEELITMKIIGNTQGVAYKTRIQETNEAISQQNANTNSRQLDETIRHNKASEAIDKENAAARAAAVEVNKNRWAATQNGGETVKNGAMLRAQRIYDSLKKLTDANGVISPDKVRQLNTEQLKYLGSSQIVKDNVGEDKSVHLPLNLSDAKYAIQLVDGDIKVLKGTGKDGEVEKSGNGGYKGLWENTKSTNVFNVATNILNEELKNAGAKELNSYMPLDASEDAVSSYNYGGGSSVSGSSSSQVASDQQLSADPLDWKKEGKYYRYKDGSLYDDNLKKIK